MLALIASAVCVLLPLVRSEGLALSLAPVCGVGAGITAVFSLLSLRSRVNPTGFSLVRRFANASVALALILVICNVCIGFRWLVSARAVALSEISASNLRSTGQGLRLYHDAFGDYAPSLLTLIETGFTAAGNLVCPYDNRACEAAVLQSGYSSYEYKPGRGKWESDPTLILAHECLPFSYGRASLELPIGYMVLFGDGSIRWLDRWDFAEALQHDRRRRDELGWP